MKKFYNRNFAYGAAALLIGAVSFTACSSEDELSNTNPTYDGESVKTQFAINIPAAAKTRMTGEYTQQDGNFLGMKDIKLIPFASMPALGTESNLGSVITLGNISDNLSATSNAKVYNDVAIPVGTGAVILYGQANKEAGTNFDKGAVTMPSDYSVLSNIKFSPVNITTNETDAKATALAAWMTSVANAEGWDAAGEGTLKDLRDEFLKTTVGSSNSVLCLMQYLYNALAKEDGAEATAIKAAIKAGNGVVESDGKLSYGEGSSLAGYPENINLPDGAAQVVWNSTKFDVVAASGNTGINVASLDSYVYPAALCYYVNSNVKTADTEVDMDAASDWTTIVGSMTGSSVAPTTRSIAIEQPINYGVGRLSTQVKFGAQRVPDSKDDGHNSSVVEIPGEGFKITGILIGGQGEVGWNYIPTATTTGSKTIYDKSMTEGMCAKYSSDFTGAITNYTLAFETESNKDVNVAIELVNGDKDFYGKDGMIIPAGGKFYLVGQLESSAATETGEKIFKQDYNTIAKFNITNLKSAYNGLPDLRTPSLQLGMSVDLNWEKGHTFDVEIK